MSSFVLRSRRRSVPVAYLLLAVFGLLGAHRLYLGHVSSGAAMAAITLVSVPLIWSGLGLLGLVVCGTWMCADTLLIPGMARQSNVVTSAA